MARSYAKLMLSTWDHDSDFYELSMEAQWLYWVMLSHPLLSLAGVLPIQERKWAKRAPNGVPETVRNALTELVDKRKIVVDWDTEEALIRTFIRHDGGARNPNIHKAIIVAISRIESVDIKRIARQELNRASDKDQRTDPDPDHPEDRTEPPTERDTERHPESTFHLPPETEPSPSSSTASALALVPNPVEQDDDDFNCVVERVVDAKERNNNVRNSRPWRATTRRNIIAEDGDLIRAELANGLDPEHVALLVLGYGTDATRERTQANWCTRECECEGDGWVRTPEGFIPCPHRAATA